MKNIVKTISLLTLITIIPGAFAANSSRVSMSSSRTSPRLSFASILKSGGVSTTGTTTTTLFEESECIDAYTSCISSNEACGANFEDCTTNVLFHAQMPKCLSSLYQCQASGVAALFGTSTISSLSDVQSTNSATGEVTRYTYPTDGSVLGQMIVGASIANKLTTDQCVRRYTNCLERDDICGADFELCTDQKEFKRQAILCDSTLARCQSDAKVKLFGSITNADNLKPTGSDEDVILVKKIKDGASLAASNAVKTCKKVTENCLINACTANPLRCVEGVSMTTVSAADFVSTGGSTNDIAATVSIKNSETGEEYLSASQIRKMLKSSCLEAIGGNKYCHMVYLKNVPTARDLSDIELQDEVFALAYADRKESVNTKIQEELKSFDTTAKTNCVETIQSCAMRSCGGGIGSVCYQRVFRSADGSVAAKTINGERTYEEIKSGCEGIVNNDPNCIYAATSSEETGYTYAFNKGTVFGKLFPKSTTTGSVGTDPIGAVATLNASLAKSYNDAAIENMKKQCQTVALGCVKSMCGSDYTKCYRLRTDIYAGTYDSGNANFDRSMNKTGGVLDYNIVIGLCMNTVKNSSACEEHLKIAAAEWRDSNYKDEASWGDTGSVRNAWAGANSTSATVANTQTIVTGCKISETAHNMNPEMCPIGSELPPEGDSCAGVMDADGCIYDQAVTQTYDEYALTSAGTTLFQQLLVDVEKEANAKYNSKLTQEQHVCVSNNNGGIMGANDNGSTFMWVKLNGAKVPKTYAMKGLKPSQFKASNDLYGSFCRARINVTSDDKFIQEQLTASGETTAYFAVGDSFTCGSWIANKTLEKITKEVSEKAQKDEGKGGVKEKAVMSWAGVAGFLGGGLGGYFGMDALQTKGSSLGGLLEGKGIKATKEANSNADKCLDEVEKARTAYRTSSSLSGTSKTTKFAEAVDHANKAKRYARSAGADVSDVDFVSVGEYTVAKDATYELDVSKVNSAKETIKELAKSAYEELNSNEKTEKRGYFNAVNSTLDAINANSDTQNSILQSLSNAKDYCNDIKAGTCKSTYTIEGFMKLKTSAVESGEADEDLAYSTFATNIDKLDKACSEVLDDDGLDSKSRRNKNIAAGAALSAVGTALGIGIARTALDIKYENAGNEAIKKWMEEIGDHIQCYLGGEELGSYGDTISLTID